MVPQSRIEFGQYCLRKLGSGIASVNVTPEQVEDRIDEALSMWREYHFNATKRAFIKYKLQPEDITNQYITVPDNVLEVLRIIPTGATFGGALFSILNYAKYQYYMAFSFGAVSSQISPFSIALSNLELLNDELGQKIGYQFNRFENRLHITTDWSVMHADEYVVYEAFVIMDTSEVWGDIWLQRYTTALIKQNMGASLQKFGNVALLNGITYNGADLYEQASREIMQLENDLQTKFSYPALGFLK